MHDFRIKRLTPKFCVVPRNFVFGAGTVLLIGRTYKSGKCAFGGSETALWVGGPH